MWKNFLKIIGFEREAEKQEIATEARTNKPKTKAEKAEPKIKQLKKRNYKKKTNKLL